MGWDNVVGIASRYGVEDPVIEFRWGEIFHTHPAATRWVPGGKAAGEWR